MLRHPALPNTPEQPAKLRVVPAATSESQVADSGGHKKFEPPIAAESLLKVIFSVVAVTVPEEPVKRVPWTPADAV
jgi:hypothetical protein